VKTANHVIRTVFQNISIHPATVWKWSFTVHSGRPCQRVLPQTWHHSTFLPISNVKHCNTVTI